MVASGVASKGLDFNDIQHVIIFSMPKEIEDYVHQIGRTGRSGKTGIATTFVNMNTSEQTLLDLKYLLMEAGQKCVPCGFTIRQGILTPVFRFLESRHSCKLSRTRELRKADHSKDVQSAEVFWLYMFLCSSSLFGLRSWTRYFQLPEAGRYSTQANGLPPWRARHRRLLILSVDCHAALSVCISL